MDSSNSEAARKEFLTYHQMTLRRALYIVLFISVVLIAISFIFGPIRNPWLVIYPREARSLVAIFTANFFHANKAHLFTNLIIFIPVGIWALKQEGMRAIYGMIMGGVFCGVATWLWGAPGSPHLGFSGVVFALYGILLISSIRKFNILLLVLLFIFLQWLGTSFFDAIRPTDFSTANHLSWIGHLGGFVGGIWSQLNDSSIALEVLLKNKDITPEEYNRIAGRICVIDKKKTDPADAKKGIAPDKIN
jgi:membrane associated rhomboid family serine protease